MGHVISGRLNQLGELFDCLRRGIDSGDPIQEHIDDIGVSIGDPLVVPAGLACDPLCPGREEYRENRNQHAYPGEGVEDHGRGIGHGRNPNAVTPDVEHPILVRVRAVDGVEQVGSRIVAAGIGSGDITITDSALFLVGTAIVIITAADVARTLVMTRNSHSRLTGPVNELTRLFIAGIARRRKNYLRRDSIQSWTAPLIIVGSLSMWLMCYLIGYTLMLDGMVGLTINEAFREAGSSLFTLGFASEARAQLSIIDFVAAATGPITIGLMISYLPSLYGSYNRRELDVALLKARAGEPNWGPEILARFAVLGSDRKRLLSLWAEWERWAADVSESHTSYPALIYTRSARPMRNWVVALLAMMDAAALSIVLRPQDRQVAPRMFLRQGLECLRDLAAATGIHYDPTPATGQPIQLSKDEFVSAVNMLIDVGYDPQRTADEAWPVFSDWRVMYESIAYDLALRVDAVPAKWSGPRRPATEEIPPVRPQYIVGSEDGSVRFVAEEGRPHSLPPEDRLG